jgi:iron complex transport system substrate-binding protein
MERRAPQAEIRHIQAKAEMTEAQPRVVSLIASATEIMHALGGGGLQVARSHECDWPERVLDLPQLTSTKFKVAGATSREIDTSVKTLVSQGLAVYEVDAESLKRIAPDVILTQDQCEVCAVSLSDVERAVQGWTECRANVVSLKPHTLADIYADNIRIAEALGLGAAGDHLNARMQARFADITAPFQA